MSVRLPGGCALGGVPGYSWGHGRLLSVTWSPSRRTPAETFTSHCMRSTRTQLCIELLDSDDECDIDDIVERAAIGLQPCYHLTVC